MSTLRVSTVVALVLTGCGGALPGKLEFWGGDHQAAFAGKPLDVPLRVRVLGRGLEAKVTTSTGDAPPEDSVAVDSPLAGVKVSFSVTSGGGSLSSTEPVTDADGYATTTWTLGAAGPQTAQVRLARDGVDVIGSPRDFEATIVTAGTFVDPRDGEQYDTITVGTQTWFAQNLRFNLPGSDTNPDFPDPTWGRFYIWDLARVACPVGWHLPSDDEWTTLELLLGKPAAEAGLYNSDNTYGRAMKATRFWPEGVGAGTNSTGFNALPTGTWLGTSALAPIGSSTKFWTSWEEPNDPLKFAWHRALYDDLTNLSNAGTLKVTGLSVRCLKN